MFKCVWLLISRAGYDSEWQLHHNHQSHPQSLFLCAHQGCLMKFPINMQIRSTSICFDFSVIIFSAQSNLNARVEMSTLQTSIWLSSTLRGKFTKGLQLQKPAQITVYFAKIDCTAKQIASWCSIAICTYLNEIIYIHLVQNCPFSMQMSLSAKTNRIHKQQR